MKYVLEAIIESIRKAPPAGLMDSCVSYSSVLNNLDRVEESNRTGQSYCGMASSMILKFLPDYLRQKNIDATIVTATASAANSCFHHYNLIKIPGKEALTIDLTASQFFTKPMTLFGGKPYFIGTRSGMRALVQEAQRNTWRALQKNCGKYGFRNLWDVDYASINGDENIRKEITDAIKSSPSPCLYTESFYLPWDITWGQRSRILYPRENLSSVFGEAAKIEKTTRDTTTPHRYLITYSNRTKITRNDGPGIKP